ncbi:MAG: energy transducer TonB [Bacteroidales bacterium]|nr:energy transducer TonB [Bacteroidales bacterium]MCB9012629.1 energy transducer TonB [Bacteroidales bacterium]
METKKSKKADLERSRTVFFQSGMIIALSLILFAFNWSDKAEEKELNFLSAHEIQTEELPPLIRIPLQETQIPKQKISDIIMIFPDDIPLEDIIFFDPEAKENTAYNFSGFADTPEVILDSPEFLPVEDQPLFNGGKPTVEFRKYIAQNLVYPQIAIDNRAQGKVYIEFLIDTKGRLVDAKVLGPLDPALDNEALRVVNSSPLWTPGKQRGKPVKVKYVFPINFVLQ